MAHARRNVASRLFRHPVAVTNAALVLLAVAPLYATTPAAAAVVYKPLKVVSIGDSYTSGTGAHPEVDGPRDCHRSTNNWFGQYVVELERAGFSPRADNRACHGAILSDLTKGKTRNTYLAEGNSCPKSDFAVEEIIVAVESSTVPGPHPICRQILKPQLEAIDKDTDLVILTIGGNDLGFEEIVTECFGWQYGGECKRLMERAERRLGGKEDVRPRIDGRDADCAVEYCYALRQELRRVLTDLKRRGPELRLALLSYPYLERDAKFKAGWFEAGRTIREHQRTFDNLQFEVLREVFHDTKKASQCTGKDLGDCIGEGKAIYLDNVKNFFKDGTPTAKFLGDNSKAWLHTIPGCLFTGRYECYHPNAAGHKAIKDLLIKYLAFNAGSRSPSVLRGSLDVVLVIDTTSSMGDDIAAVKSYASTFVDKLSADSKSYRVGLVTYRDFPERSRSPTDYASRTDLPFSENKGLILDAINGIGLGGGGDFPEAVYSGLRSAIGFPWRVGVKKVVVQFGDAPPLDPEPVTGLRSADISAAARAVDPAVVYSVDVSSGNGASAGMREIAAATGGRVLSSPSPRDVTEVLGEIVTEAASTPLAWAGGPYAGTIGTSITLDARGSFDDGSIVSYEWDVNGDGRYDVTTTEPEFSHSFLSDYRGIVGVRVTDDRKLRAEATAMIIVSSDGDPIPAERDNCARLDNPGQEDFDDDGLGDACDETPGFPPRPEVAQSEEDLTVAWVAFAGLSGIIAFVGLAVYSSRGRATTFCDRCGQRLARGAFCDACGAPVGV